MKSNPKSLANLEKPEAFLTVEELAGLVSLTPGTVYKMAQSGRIPVVKIGRSSRFLYSEVRAALGKSTMNPK